MSRETVDEICKALPGAEWADHRDGSHDAWKVGGKMFACIGVKNDGVSVKTPSIADATMLIDLGRAQKAPYFHRSWVRLPWGATAPETLKAQIETSYGLVRASLTKKMQSTMGAWP